MDHDRLGSNAAYMTELDAPGPAQRAKNTVVTYLYVHTPDEQFSYPTSRASSDSAAVAMRYLECAATQAASVRLRDDPVDFVLVTNLRDLRDPKAVTSRGVALLESMEAMGVQMLYADYAHRNRISVDMYPSSRYLLDAVVAVIADEPDDSEHRYWFTDVDCVWVDLDKVFAAAPPAGSVACVYIPYPPDWDIIGTTPRRVGEFGRTLGDCPVPVPWVGGELFGGTPRDLRHLIAECDVLDDQIGDNGDEVPAEEHLLTLVGGLGRVSFTDQCDVVWRLSTGPRHEAPRHSNPGALGLWHLPSEKGLSFRRTAGEVLSGRTSRLRRDLTDPVRAMKRFNIEGTGLGRRIRDDGWIAVQRLRQMLPS
jgi:hypothetical protein